jgi:hypothetical protein
VPHRASTKPGWHLDAVYLMIGDCPVHNHRPEQRKLREEHLQEFSVRLPEAMAAKFFMPEDISLQAL